MTQQELSKLLSTSISVVGRYEHDEMTPSIKVAKNIASFLETTVGYLLGETNNANLFRDLKMLKRFEDIVNLPDNQKECILTTMDHFIRSAKISVL